MKTVDQIYSWSILGQACGSRFLQCRLRIFQPHPEVQTVIISEMGLVMRWLLPGLVGTFIDQIVQEFHLHPANVVWLERYTAHTNPFAGDAFTQVTFDWYNGKTINPKWTAIPGQLAQALISEPLLPVQGLR
jgi:hypothetical protein